MLKKILKFFTRVIIAGFILYGYNLMIQPLNLMIPINIVTLGLICVFGILAIPFLALMLIFIF